MADGKRVDEVVRVALDLAEQVKPPTAAERARQARLAAQDARAERATLLRMASPAIDPDVFRRIVRGDKPISSKAFRVVQRWHELRTAGKRPRPWLILLGGTGAGKTVAAAWMLAREPGWYVVSEDLVRWHRRNDIEWARARRANLLVIDDVGTEVDAELARAMFFATMNHRSGVATVVTTNKTREELLEWIDPRMSSRLMQYAHLVDCRGPDLRAPGASPWSAT